MAQRQRDPLGRFRGERRRNCEAVPRLPASAVRFAIEDPRRLPGFLFVWLDSWDRMLASVRVSKMKGGLVELAWPGAGSPARLRVTRWPLPRGGSSLLLLCPACGRAMRYLYFWERDSNATFWKCRGCSGLRYVSEGGGRNPFGAYPRFPLDPLAFANPDEAREL
jgi:hypothetical protein